MGGAINAALVEVEQHAFAVDAEVRRLLHSQTRGARRVLEIGCGVAQYRDAVGPSYIGIDITLAEYRPGLARDPDLLGSAFSLPFAEGCFDVAVMHCVFHLLPNQVRCAHEAARILTRGGRLIIVDWSRPSWAQLLASGNAQSWISTAPRLRDLASLLDSAGLDADRIELTSRPGLRLVSSVWAGRRLMEIAIDRWARSRVTIIARKR